MKEDFVQYVWKFKLFNTIDLRTTSGKSIEIVHFGFQNFASGPDFTQAKIKIDNQLWAGNVEIHIQQNDWNMHKHDEDEAYNNVILHVIYEDSNLEVKTQSDRILETLVLKDNIFKHTESKYNELIKGKKNFVPCQDLVQIDEILLKTYYESLISERLERKINEIEQDLKIVQGDLDKAFLMSLFKYFGAPQNKVPFEVLASNVQINHLTKCAVSIENLEAYLFGMAGLLQNTSTNAYKIKLENEFAYQKQLYQLNSPLALSHWKFAGVRPPSFPTLRIAQLAAVLYKEQRWFSYIQNEESIFNIREKLNVEISTFWKTHYHFESEKKISQNSMSDAFLDKIMINVIVPFLFYYGKFVQDEKYIERALSILMHIKPEQNQITKGWKTIGFIHQNALHSQALIELKNNYCDLKKCLDCRLSYKILNNTAYE